MQGPLFQKIRLKENKSFNILKVERPYFAVPWHFHPEVEIMLVVRGHGTRFVGDSIERFEPYDLVMIGANLAHVWKNSHEHFTDDTDLIAEARVILFQESCFGMNFFSIPEMSAISELLSRAERGIKFTGKTRERVADLIIHAHTLEGAKQFAALIGILDELATTKDYSYLCCAGYNQKVQASDLIRLNTVLDYLMKNFHKPIRLEDVANIANLTPNAFCRYFKTRTNKTVIQFVNELRIGYAHKLLVETQSNIDQIAFDSGFHNLSNFYEQFQKITGKSPFRFRKEHNQKVFIKTKDEPVRLVKMQRSQGHPSLAADPLRASSRPS